MHMNNLIIKGGYGEHGRSCFMIEYRPQRYCMVDCGIMDTDSHPEPYLTQEEAAATDYLLLTHAHKDHSGAIPYLINKGFQGWILMSQDTARLLKPDYEKVYCLDDVFPGRYELDGISLLYGRSGHCPGSLWFLVKTEKTTVFFSGDYQADSLVYACDVPHGFQADLAVVDMAHDECRKDAASLRDELVKIISEYTIQGRKVIMPVQTFGRGNEILYLLSQFLPSCRVALDQRFINAEEIMLESTAWIREESRRRFLEAYEKDMRMPAEMADIVLIADTHLDRDENRNLVRKLLAEDAAVVLTGRRREGSFAAELLDEGKAVRLPFPHHSSRLDAQVLAAGNSFRTVLPYHNEIREVWF